MSYDFSLHRVAPGESIDDVLARAEDAFDDEQPQLDANAHARQAELVATLIALNHRLQPLKFGPLVELTDPSFGTQITIYGETISISMPYQHVGDVASLAMAETWDYVEACVEATGFVPYDPQLGRVVDLGLDLAEVTQSYLDVIDMMPGFVEHARAEMSRRNFLDALPLGRRPWWKFWVR